ncbi:alpha/beta hydrolase family protein [Streptomyces sp. NPDC056517]|uniref:alpha/beta hydrolase family protein n=1 Tax=Streptomyces sp. NPDC056517 TaxID=3345848 RepID=UPI003686C3BA
MAIPTLPAPTGSHPVGTTSVYLQDVSRPDPWVADVPTRELMISIWYPAARPSGPRARYLTRTESAEVLAGRSVGVAPDVLSSVRTHAFPDAPLDPGLRELPLIVLSPGFTRPRATLTSIGEDLASHGYVAVAIDHTYETAATTFPDGRVAAFALGRGFARTPEFWRKVKTGRARDASFVLDRLLGGDPPWAGAAVLAPDRIGMAGHSAGGAATIAAMLADERIRAGGNVDGSTDPLIPDTGLDRPFLFLGRDGQYSPGDGPAADTWARDWPLLDRLEALAGGGGRQTPVLHRSRPAGRPARHAARRGHLGAAHHDDHPHLPARLLRPAPARRPAPAVRPPERGPSRGASLPAARRSGRRRIEVRLGLSRLVRSATDGGRLLCEMRASTSGWRPSRMSGAAAGKDGGAGGGVGAAAGGVGVRPETRRRYGDG